LIKYIIIDDEPYVISLFPKILDWESLDFELAGTFSRGTEALKWLETNECDVIFTDISMPDISGIDIAKTCSQKFPGIQIVFFSAHRNFDYALDAIKYAVFDYVLKPISKSILQQTVLKLKSKIAEEHQKLTIQKVDYINTDDYDAIAVAKQFVANHYHEDISISDVAKHVGFSPGYFSNYFKQKTNENFVSYLRNIRLEKAKELLKDKKIKISLIPQQIGFKSYSYFTKTFQDAFGITPTDYRDEYLMQVNNDDNSKNSLE